MHTTSHTLKLAWELPNTNQGIFTLTYGESGPHCYAALDFTLTLTTAQYALRYLRAYYYIHTWKLIHGDPIATWEPS